MTTDELWSEAREIESLSKLLSKLETMCDSERTRSLFIQTTKQLYGKGIGDTEPEEITPELSLPLIDPEISMLNERLEILTRDYDTLLDVVMGVGLRMQKCRPVESKLLLSSIGVSL